MRSAPRILMVLCTIALGTWMFYYFPGWLGIVIGSALLAYAVIATVLLAFGVGARQRAIRLWKEFLDFLYGL